MQFISNELQIMVAKGNRRKLWALRILARAEVARVPNPVNEG